MGALGTLLGCAHPPHCAPPPPLPLLLHLLLLRRRPPGASCSAAAQAGAARGASLPRNREQSLFHGRDAGTAPESWAGAWEALRLAVPWTAGEGKQACRRLTSILPWQRRAAFSAERWPSYATLPSPPPPPRLAAPPATGRGTGFKWWAEGADPGGEGEQRLLFPVRQRSVQQRAGTRD